MSTQNIIDKIIADAKTEAETILQTATDKANSIIENANAQAERIRKETEKTVCAQTQSIKEKKEATARLDSSKILLAEKRNVLQCIYKMALDELVALDKESAVGLASKLLEKYAEQGDTLFFAQNYKYVDEVSILPVIKERGIIVSNERIDLDGGMRLVGKFADKDLSYGAILEADKQLHQADIAKKLFRN